VIQDGIGMEPYVIEWLNLAVRWLHFTAGIAWIGASLYFVMLDNSLRPPRKPQDAERGVHGELWAVHGGGFYCSQKFLTGPRGEPLSDNLHWSKWEAYTTWLSGMALLAIIYWYGANTYLIDRSVLDLSVPAGIAISAGSLVVGWFIYDVGALMGTLMVWNVFFHIIPGQKRMVAALRAGQPVDPRPGVIGKQRSVHNTYLTLPVLFIMISNHYPMTYGHPQGWLILAVFILAGALIRQFFVLRHRGRVVWALPAIGVALLLGVAVALAPRAKPAQTGAAAVSFAQVQPIIAQRCTVCHAERPTYPGFAQSPAGVLLDTPERIRAAAPRIHQQTIATQAMPIGNLTQMKPEERALLGQWLAAGMP
jgi:uncharacterized membrane protein